MPAPVARPSRPPRPLLPRVGPVGRFFSGLVVRALASLSPRGLRRLAGFVGGLAWTLRIRRRVALDNVTRALPETTPQERARIARGAYDNMALAALESLSASARPAEELDALIQVENWDVYERAAAEGKGVLVATAHFGNWELLGEVMAARKIPVNAVVRPLTGALNARIVESRLKAGLKLIHPRGALRESLRALARGEVVAMLVDQVIAAKHGVFVPFFGRPASTNPALSMAAKRSGAPVIVAVAAREGDGLRLFIEGPVPMPDTGDVEADVKAHTALVTALLEKWIRRYPDQWLWLHRRWKVAPPSHVDA